MFVQRLFGVCARFLPRVMLCVHFISFTASAQKTGPKPAVHFSILGESGSSLLAEGTVDVLVDPKIDTVSIRVICVEIDGKHKTPYLFINFWTSRDAYKKMELHLPLIRAINMPDRFMLFTQMVLPAMPEIGMSFLMPLLSERNRKCILDLFMHLIN